MPQELNSCDPNYKPDKLRDIRVFVYDSQTKKLFGRTSKSWGQCFLCYVVVYTLMTAVSTGMFSVFYFTLVPYDVPRLIGVASLLNGMPGVSMQPSLPDPVYAVSNKTLANRVTPFVDNLHNYLQGHLKTQGGKDAIDCNDTTVLKKGQSCKLDMNELFPVGSTCTKANSYGFTVGQPCIALKINRIYGWKPELYDQLNLPVGFPTNRFDDKRMALNCYGSFPTDRENLGIIKYIPEKGISTKYFPYLGQKNYLDPFVWVQFLNVTPTLDLRIKCQFFAKNLGFHYRVDISYVQFELVVDN